MEPKSWYILAITIVLVGCCVGVCVYLIQKIVAKNILWSGRNYSNILAVKAFSRNPFNHYITQMPCFYINLDRSPHRRQQMEASAAMHGLKLKRVRAIDGKQRVENRISDTPFQCDFTDMSSNEIACTLSHIKAIRLAYQTKKPMAIILEDDVSFQLVPFWSSIFLDEVLTYANTHNIGIIQLAWNGGNANCGYTSNFTIQTQAQHTYCHSTAAYVITRKGMEDVLTYVGHENHIKKGHNNTPPTRGHADIFLYQITPTIRTGLPMLMPDNTNSLMNTTINPTDPNGIVYSIKHYNNVLKIYINNFN